MYKPKRDFSIDVLRGIAVLLVLFRHFHSTDYTIFIPYLEKIGWLGVDLFFVLSGFLISTLLYNEIDKTGKLDFKRFFIRSCTTYHLHIAVLQRSHKASLRI